MMKVSKGVLALISYYYTEERKNMRVGIDLGTTYCAIAKVDEKTGKASVIKNSYGLSTTPSVLYFEQDGSIIHGQEAKDYYEEGNPETEAYFKYKMGDPNFEAEHYGKSYLAEDLAAELLKGLIKEAEEECGEKITEAIITVPAYFEDPKRKATIRAGEKAGVKVLGVINEPTAAVFAYGIHEKEENKTIMIYDLGGGTFDITIAKVTKKDIKVLGSDGDHELGGRDWDHAIVEYISNLFYDEFDIMVDEDYEFNNTLRVLAEKTKKSLASKKSETIKIDYRGRKAVYTLTEEKFEEISAYLVERTENVIKKLFEELFMDWSDIDGVILVGGSTRMKMIRNFVEKISGKKPYDGVNPDLSVAIGAAIRANIDENGNPIKKRVYIGGGKQERIYQIAGAKSIQEATSHSLGMITETKNREKYINNIMIAKNSSVPAKYSETYHLRVGRDERENHLDVYMIQGESKELTYPLNGVCLGKYVFSGIKNTGNREEDIIVTYEYNRDSVVSVEAIQKNTGKNLKLSVEAIEDDMSWVILSPKDRDGGRTKINSEIDIVLAIDLSGSMSSALDQVKDAAKSFVDQFDLNYTRIGIVGFASRVAILGKLSSDKKKLYRTIDKMNISDELGYGTSVIPFSISKSMLEDKDRIKYIFVLTDGAWSHQNQAIHEAKQLWRENIDIIAVGFAQADRKFLHSIASKDEFAQLTDLSNLVETFTGIARKM